MRSLQRFSCKQTHMCTPSHVHTPKCCARVAFNFSTLFSLLPFRVASKISNSISWRQQVTAHKQVPWGFESWVQCKQADLYTSVWNKSEITGWGIVAKNLPEVRNRCLVFKTGACVLTWWVSAHLRHWEQRLLNHEYHASIRSLLASPFPVLMIFVHCADLHQPKICLNSSYFCWDRNYALICIFFRYYFHDHSLQNFTPSLVLFLPAFNPFLSLHRTDKRFTVVQLLCG